MRRRRSVAALAGALCLVALAAGCAKGQSEPNPSDTPAPLGAADARLDKFYRQHLSWAACDDGFECAKALVPLDYQDPSGDDLELSMIKRGAVDGEHRIGSLVLNPGGPGGSGIDYTRAADQVVGDSVRTRFDIVGFDPRGVGTSDPIVCLSADQTDRMLSVLGAPTATVDAQAVAARARSFGENCARRSPQLTPNVGTVPAAKDLDIIRAVLGEAKLNYVGRSYGSFLGVTYAGLFPGNVGRFVFDGAMAPTLTQADLARGQAEGFELALGRFVGDCPRHTDCPLPAKPARALSKIRAWLGGLAQAPMKSGGRELTQPAALAALLGPMYDPASGWPQLRDSLTRAFAGEAAGMLNLADEFAGRDGDGRYRNNAIDALYAVNCLDRSDRADVATTATLAEQWTATSPTFGAYFAWGNLPCATWPAPATDQPHPISAAGSGPIMVVGTKYDPATPYQWAVSMERDLSNAALVSWDGDGHTGYRRGSSCVDAAVDRFLLSGVLPPAETRC